MVSFEALPAMVQKGDPSEARVTLRDNGSPSQDGITCIDHSRANIVTILSGRGEISVPGERDTWVIPGVDPYRTYFVEILGADSNEDIWGQTYGTLTLEDPHPVSYYHEDYPGASGGEWHPGSIRAENGVGRNIRLIFIEGTPGDYVLTLESVTSDGVFSYHAHPRRKLPERNISVLPTAYLRSRACSTRPVGSDACTVQSAWLGCVRVTTASPWEFVWVRLFQHRLLSSVNSSTR